MIVEVLKDIRRALMEWLGRTIDHIELLNPLMLKVLLQKLSSGSMILLTVPFELRMVLQNI